jgi:hypothetical protein
VAAIIAAGVLFAVLFVTAWRRTAAEMREEVGSTATVNTPSSVSALLTSRPEELAGHLVFLNDVRVEPGPKPNVFFVAGAGGDRLLVVTDTPATLPPGSVVDISGEMHKVPSRQVLRTDWKLSASEAKAISQERVYLAADTVRHQNHKPSAAH